MSAPEALDESTQARLMESARQYGALLHRMEAQQGALLRARQEAAQALARGLTGLPERYLRAQLRVAELSLQVMAQLPYKDRQLRPVMELLQPPMQAIQVELQWCQLQMEVAFVAMAWGAVGPEAQGSPEAPEAQRFLALVQGQAEAQEAWARSLQAVPPLLGAMAELEAQAQAIPGLGSAGARQEAWRGLSVAPVAGLAYRVESPLRPWPELLAAWKGWRKAWVHGLVPPKVARPTLGARVANSTKRLTDRLGMPLQGNPDGRQAP